MKAYGWNRGTAPLILNLSTSHLVIMPWPLYPCERTLVAIEYEAGWD